MRFKPTLKELSQEAEARREKLSLRIASSIEWERFLTTDFSVIVDLFQGQYASRLKCKVCSHTSTTYQPFTVLSIPIPKKIPEIILPLKIVSESSPNVRTWRWMSNGCAHIVKKAALHETIDNNEITEESDSPFKEI